MEILYVRVGSKPAIRYLGGIAGRKGAWGALGARGAMGARGACCTPIGGVPGRGGWKRGEACFE